nr:MAG TPA: hypothetical protein [Caudoviricetes sp.]
MRYLFIKLYHIMLIEITILEDRHKLCFLLVLLDFIIRQISTSF